MGCVGATGFVGVAGAAEVGVGAGVGVGVATGSAWKVAEMLIAD